MRDDPDFTHHRLVITSAMRKQLETLAIEACDNPDEVSRFIVDFCTQTITSFIVQRVDAFFEDEDQVDAAREYYELALDNLNSAFSNIFDDDGLFSRRMQISQEEFDNMIASVEFELETDPEELGLSVH
jgi:hypothetical protein